MKPYHKVVKAEVNRLTPVSLRGHRWAIWKLKLDCGHTVERRWIGGVIANPQRAVCNTCDPIDTSKIRTVKLNYRETYIPIAVNNGLYTADPIEVLTGIQVIEMNREHEIELKSNTPGWHPGYNHLPENLIRRYNKAFYELMAVLNEIHTHTQKEDAGWEEKFKKEHNL